MLINGEVFSILFPAEEPVIRIQGHDSSLLGGCQLHILSLFPSIHSVEGSGSLAASACQVSSVKQR